MLLIHLLWTFLVMATAGMDLDRIPDDFLIGVASASYQIEGGWNEHGKGENVWDRYTHARPDRIRDGSSGDIACDSYHKYKEDVKLLKDMGAQIYRFSISWPRILPTGFVGVINQKGIDYYNNLINELLENNIEPMVTLYHWDLPQPLQDLGGWTNPILADYFCDYADVVFRSFGDRVKKWLTFNEPFEFCNFSYGHSMFAPGLDMSGTAEYLAGHTVLKAHAKAYHLYCDNYKPLQKGEIGITLSVNWVEPKTNSTEDLAASNDNMQFTVGWFAHPIFSEKGDYPEELKTKVAARSKEEGLNRSRLPVLDQYWIDFIKGTSDFFGVNHYTTTFGTYGTSPHQARVPSFARDHGVVNSVDPSWSKAPVWLNIVPWGFRKALNWVKDEFNNPVIYVTENGCSDSAEFNDQLRIRYYHEYLTEMLKAIHEDGCQVKVYTAWTLMDDFEWTSGYTEKFGLHHVDFNDPERKRTPRKSVQYFRDLIKNRKLPDGISNKTEL